MYAKTSALIVAILFLMATPALAKGAKHHTRSEIHAERDSDVEMKVGVGKVYGLNSFMTDGDATIFSGDLLFPVGQHGFIPMGLSRWSGAMNIAIADIEMSVLAVDTGFGYKFRPSRAFSIPLGLRGGFYEMTFETSYLGESAEFKDSGTLVSPFLGLNYGASGTFAIGYEARVPIFMSSSASSDGGDDSDDGEASKSNSVPSYHMLMLSFSL